MGEYKNILNMYGAVKNEKETEPDIKNSRPIPVKKNTINDNDSRVDEYNDTLTFFQ